MSPVAIVHHFGDQVNGHELCIRHFNRHCFIGQEQGLVRKSRTKSITSAINCLFKCRIILQFQNLGSPFERPILKIGSSRKSGTVWVCMRQRWILFPLPMCPWPKLVEAT